MNLFLFTFALAFESIDLNGPSRSQQAPAPAYQTEQEVVPPDPAVQLDDIIVEGRPLETATEAFVHNVSGAVAGRGAATWRQPVCIGVSGLQRPAAEHVIDRISTAAERLELRLGQPGCKPQVFIAFTDDADEMARAIVESRPREFRIGLAGTDLGQAALDAFQRSEKPVRWWQVSVPVNADTGRSAQRPRGHMPFEMKGEITRPSDLGPTGLATTASRLRSSIRDDLAQVIIIVDSDRIGSVSLDQLSDYLAMISLAQISADGQAATYESILNLFAPDGSPPPALTDWDMAYLEAVYGAVQNQGGGEARLGAVAGAMARSIRDRQRQGPAN